MNTYKGNKKNDFKSINKVGYKLIAKFASNIYFVVLGIIVPKIR